MNFERNIKRIIKKRGYKLSNFSKIYLQMSYQTFNHQLKNDNLKIKTIVTLLHILKISFEELTKGVLIDSDLMNTNTVQINKPLLYTKETETTQQAKPEGPKKAISNYKGLKDLILKMFTIKIN